MVYCGNSCAAEVHVASGSLRNGIFRLGLIDIPRRQCNENLVVLIPQNSNGHLALCTDQRNLELEVVVLSFFLN